MPTINSDETQQDAESRLLGTASFDKAGPGEPRGVSPGCGKGIVKFILQVLGVAIIVFVLKRYLSNDITPLKLGDPYQGGIVFSIDASGQRGLIAATEDYAALTTDTNAAFCISLKKELDLYKVAGVAGWRLPGVDELKLLYLNRRFVPALDTTVPTGNPNKNGIYATAPANDCSVTGMKFSDGRITSHPELTYSFHLRLIHSF